MPAKRVRTPLPLATVALTAAIVAVFAVEFAGDGMEVCQRFGFVAAKPSLATALSSLFVHDPSSLLHVGGNLAFLVIFGTIVERDIGSLRFLAVFLAGGLAGAALHIVVGPTSTVPLVGCSGSLFAILAVGAALFGPGMLAFVAVLAATNILHTFGGPGDAAVSFGCHLGGFTMGAALVVLARVRGIDLNRTVAA